MSEKYDEYLKDHTLAVISATFWIINNTAAGKDLPPEDMRELVSNALGHDGSKFYHEEYGPYDEYFYGTPDEDAFNYAWLHHIHHSPHHWQHWLLMNDDGKYRDPGKVVALEMPKIYALEMIADWWSFSWRSGNLSEVFDWYESHKDCIILHEKTREYVESVLDEIRQAIDRGDV